MPSAPTLCIITGMRVVAWALAILMLAGCDGATGSVIDGWPIGQAKPCTLAAENCPAEIAAAIEALDLREPGHAPILDVRLYEEGLVRSRDGAMVQIARSGGPMTVAVIRLANHKIHAIGVRLDRSFPTIVDWGP